MLLIIILYVLLASSFIIAKKAILYADPFFLIGFRMIVAGFLLLAYNRLKNPLKYQPSLNWFDIAKVTMFHIYLAFVLEFWALQYLSANKVIIMYSLTPFIAGILSYFILQERLSIQKIAGIIVGFFAVTHSFLSLKELLTIDLHYIPLAEIILLIAIVSSAYAWFIIQRLLDQGHSISRINGLSMVYGGMLSLLTWSILNRANIQTIAPVYHWPQFLLWVGLLIIISNAIIYNLYGYLVHRYSITLITFAGFLCPVFGSLFEILFFGASAKIGDLITILLLVVGLYLFCANQNIIDKVKRAYKSTYS